MINNKNNAATTSLLKEYDNSNNVGNQTLNYEDKVTKEDIVIPMNMLPDTTHGQSTFRFSNTCKKDIEPLVCLNTLELEIENHSSCEEFKIKKLRIINSPR